MSPEFDRYENLPNEADEYRKIHAWQQRNTLERLRVAMRGATLDPEDTAELMKLIDAELARIGGTS